MQSLFHTEVFAFTPAAGSNFTNTFSETNKMPGHGRNVHEEALSGHCKYYSFAETSAALMKVRFAHSPYGRDVTLRFRNLAFERADNMAADIQCVLNALVGSEPVVRSVRMAAPGRPYIEATVYTGKAEHIVDTISRKVVVMDRHGFHVARGTVDTQVATRPPRRGAPRAAQFTPDTNSSTEVDAALAYCKDVRQLPQKERHFRLDGLPCVPVRAELVRPDDETSH